MHPQLGLTPLISNSESPTFLIVKVAFIGLPHTTLPKSSVSLTNSTLGAAASDETTQTAMIKVKIQRIDLFESIIFSSIYKQMRTLFYSG